MLVGALTAISLLTAGGSAPITGISTVASVSPSAPGSYSPADGHSPQLTQQLTGPLTGTGIARPGSARGPSRALASATSGLLNGIDVASFQHPNGAAINWTQVAGAGYTFVAIKATEGNYYVNPHYATDAAGATAAGMYVAAYHFAIPQDSTGAAQADYADTHAGSYKVGGHYLPIMLDLEYDPYSPGDGLNQCYSLTPSAMVSWISSFVTEATKVTGAAPIIYTPQAWWNACTGNSTAFGGDLLWVPAYQAGSPGVLPAGWGTWTMWQYTASGSVPGVTGPVDLDYFSAGPQAEQTAVNSPVSIQIRTLNALAGQQVSYSATGLPPGVTISPAGQIAGAPTAGGVYQVTVTPQGTGTILPATVSFTWSVASQPAVALAAQATNGVPYALAPQLGNGTTWQSLGGTVIAPPAVVASPNPNGTSPASPLFIAPGTNDLLYIRGVTGSWQRLGPNGASCLSAAAVITGSTLTVACETTSHTLSYNTATVPSTGLPQFTSAFQNLGGTLSAGPAVASVGGTLTFFVRDTNGAIYTRTLTTNKFVKAAWTCLGQPAAALQAATGVTVFACQGTNHALYEASNSGAGWSAAVNLSGTLAAGPGIAATSNVPVLAVVGTNNVVYERTPATGYTSLTGVAATGVEAAALN